MLFRSKRMIDGLSQLWNTLTGGKVVSRQEYIEFVFAKMDQDKEGKYTKDKIFNNLCVIFD